MSLHNRLHLNDRGNASRAMQVARCPLRVLQSDGRPSACPWATARSRNIHGFPRAPLAIITASHPVSSKIRAAASRENTSPLAMTGMPTASFTALITHKSALPLYPWFLVRPWTQTASAPAASMPSRSPAH